MQLQHLRIILYHRLHGLPDGLRGFILRIGGIDPHRQNDPEFHVHFFRDPPGKTVDLPGRHGIRHLDMDRTDGLLRPIAVQDQVIGPLNLWIRRDLVFQLDGKLAVHPCADDAAQALQQDLQTGLQDHHGNHRAQISLDAHAPEEAHPRCHQRGQGDDRVKGGVRPGGHQGLRAELFPLGLDIPPQEEFDQDGRCNNDQRYRRIAGCLRVKDLVQRLPEGGHAGQQHDHRDGDGADMFDPTVAVGVLFVRRLVGQLGAEDGDHRGQGVT